MASALPSTSSIYSNTAVIPLLLKALPTLSNVATKEESVCSLIYDYTFPDINVFYLSGLTTDKLVLLIRDLQKPQVCMWYMGAYGLKVEAAKFYKPLLTTIRVCNPCAQCMLYDLTAWGALKRTDVSTSAVNRNVGLINKFKLRNIEAVASAIFFGWLQGERNEKVVKELNGVVMNRAALWAPSAGFENGKVAAAGLFKQGSASAILQGFGDRNCAKMYSPLQYLEGLFLISYILEQCKTQDEVNIVFALPNDEAKYYAEAYFANDLVNFLQNKFGDALKGKRINVMFYAFTYGDVESARPYNAGEKSIKTIRIEEVV